MILAVLVSLTVGQAVCPAYTRTKVDDNDARSHCLYWTEGQTIEWRVNDQGNPETTGDTEFTAVDKAIASWQTEFVSCGSLALNVGPRSTSRIASYASKSANQNLVIWRFETCTSKVGPSDGCWKDDDCGNQFDCWQHNSGALAITTTSFDPISGRILDADIELNTPGFIFTAVDSPPCIKPVYNQLCVATDIQNTLTHEFGHSLGLAHSCQMGSTMYASAAPTELGKRALDPGSKQFVCDVYPKNLPSQDCVSPAYNGELGPVARGCGCSAGAGAGWAVIGLVALARRRARAG